MSKTTKTIQQILTKIQNELNVPKNRVNKFSNYEYRNLDDILEAVKPLLAKYDVTLKLDDEIVSHGDRVYIRSIVTFEKNGQVITGSALAREPESKKGMDLMQLTGTCSSYARKYALAGLLLLDDSKDADSVDHRHVNHPRSSAKNNSLAYDSAPF
jgi:hypothetical protein|tara:strand:+ start:94 stop:561 length:468 start_codon:yes stop_codon:yes gene_type:complete